MAQSLKAQYRAARKKRDRLMDQVYSCAPHGRVVFSDCLKLHASTELRQAYEDARAKCLSLELEAVAAGKAWHGAFGMLTWNS